jgi:hypothetical protein
MKQGDANRDLWRPIIAISHDPVSSPARITHSARHHAETLTKIKAAGQASG